MLLSLRKAPRTFRRGATIVEAAVVIPICLMIILGIFEFSRLIMTQNLCDNAARVGARYAMVNTSYATTSDVINYVDGRLPRGAKPFVGYNKDTNIQAYESNPDGTRVGAAGDPDTWQNAAFNELIAVRIFGDFKTIMPAGWMGFTQVQVQSISMVYSEAN